MEHFSHGHPMLLSDHQDQQKDEDEDEQQKDEDDGGEEISCSGCCLPLSSSGGGDPTYYNCIQCKYFLHKSCAELPHKIIHFLHPRHPLTLLVANVSKPGKRKKCCYCTKKILGFTYQCSLCNFYLDIKCASLLDIVQAEGHKHSFMLFRPMMKLSRMYMNRYRLCDMCGQGIKGMSYLCTTCQFLVHESCITITKTIKLIGHSHQLDLSYFASGQQICYICNFEIQENFSFYSCSICTYNAHFSCATLEDHRDPAFVLEDENQEPIIPLDLVPNNHNETNIITRDFSTINLEENQIATTELEHFSHPHVLVLGENDLECDKKYCEGCLWPIFDLPFYNCSQCNFHLHKDCAQLPHKISHVLHQHPLTLRSNNEYVNTDYMFSCDGFAYSCDTCKFSIDVKYSLLTETLEHKSHPHTLRLFRQPKHDDDDMDDLDKCKGCNSEYLIVYACEGCRFYIDLDCAALPYTTKHRCPKHNWEFYPFHLTFGSEEKGYQRNDADYCDVCEEERFWYNWFYYCEDCDYSAHPECLRNYHKKYRKRRK